MKSWFVNRFYNIAYYIFRVLFLLTIKRLKSPVWVVDIDNTLTIFDNKKGLEYIDPNPRKTMIQYLKNQISTSNYFFLSARNVKFYNATRSWLNMQGLETSITTLFFVKKAEDKLDYLNRLIKYNKEIIFIDDMSYNHENGEVLLYEKTINKVLSLNIDYRGIKYIENFKN